MSKNSGAPGPSSRLQVSLSPFVSRMLKWLYERYLLPGIGQSTGNEPVDRSSYALTLWFNLSILAFTRVFEWIFENFASSFLTRRYEV